MAGFGSGFGGFGQSNNTSTTGFGGFGASNTNTNTGFGASNTPAFGANANPTGGGLFGNSGTSAFGGGTTGGFGANTTTSAFGAKPAFGATTTGGGGLFGGSGTGTAATGTGGGFGGFGNTASSTGGTFGGSTLFGSTPKPAFGTSTNTGGTSLFGGGSTGGGAGFGTNTTGAFGAPSSTALAGNIGDPPGTAQTPFTAFVEKETAAGGSSVQNSFQNILFQDPYKKWSADELRLVDYAQGRRFGNASGAGAFGNTSFGGTSFGGTQNAAGGFGTTNTTGGGLFGGASNANNAFGSNTGTTTSAFGAAGGGGLFGTPNKPAAGGGLFGTSTSQPAQTGGLFGSSFGGTAANTPSAFGANTAATGGGGLFGQANTQAKPAGFGFGATGTTAGNAFGTAANTNAFGTNSNAAPGTTTGGLFGAAPQSTGLFGGSNQAQPTNAFGGAAGFGGQTQQAGSSLFGGNNQQQNKPAGTGLFGNAGTTGGGVFGGGNTATTGFGGAANTGTSSLFAPKPAATTGLFGNAAGAQPAATGTGLFGGLNQQPQQQQQQGGLFGGALGQAQQKPSLFGGSTQQSGTGLFGSQPAQPANSFFQNPATQQQQQQQQQQATGLGGSLFGQQQPAQTTPQSLTTSINDLSAFGTSSLFSNLAGGDVQNPGPLATPLSSSKPKPMRSSILSTYKMNPTNRFVTPQKRGFGFSYSTYGTPTSGSPMSAASTPGSLGPSVINGTLARSLHKSVSTNSLRRSLNADESILSPGAFSTAGSRNYASTGSIKKLVINREMRTDLFSTPSKEKQPEANSSRKLTKRVSFDTSNMDEPENGQQGSNAPATGQTPSAGQEYLRPPGREVNGNGSTSKNAPSSAGPEMEQVKGKELAVVHEEESNAVAAPAASPSGAANKVQGEYWMKPTRDEIMSMNRVQRQKVADFTVGRHGVGFIRFKVPVDLTSIDLDDIIQKIVVLETRQATVYPNSAKKPPVGRGLNVPALISLEHSWPRGKDKRTLDRHIERLKRIEGTKFENYDVNTGVWSFSVEHFTTYGLDYDDETDAEEAGQVAKAAAGHQSLQSSDPPSPVFDSDQDDTFEFRKRRRTLPGAFDYMPDDEEDEHATPTANSQSFLGGRSAGSLAKILPSTEQDDEQLVEGYDTSGDEDSSASLDGHQAAERDRDSLFRDDIVEADETPGGVLRARMRAIKDSTAPVRFHVTEGDDWMEMLQKTVSPQKRDRALLRSLMMADAESNQAAKEEPPSKALAKSRVVSDGRGFATSIDLMTSLFEKPKPPPSRGVKWPYQKPKTLEEEEASMSPEDRSFYNSVRTTWGPDESFFFATNCKSFTLPVYQQAAKNGILDIRKGGFYSEHVDIRQAKFSHEPSARSLRNQLKITEVGLVNNVPTVQLVQPASLMAFFQDVDKQTPATSHERLVWELASVLFDEVRLPRDQKGTPNAVRHVRRENLSKFWKALVEPASARGLALSRLHEEKAIACLAGHRIPEACQQLLNGKNFRLATLVALIGNDGAKKDMKEQLRDWREANFLSEFSDPIRALYELLAGNVCVSEGKKAAPMADRMESFVISKKFGLDWRQAFGLRLWYAASSTDDLTVAIGKFNEDVEQGREARPPAWYIEQGIQPIWKDEKQDEREDLLWGLLKLYAFEDSDLEEVLRPENSELSPIEARLSWQLGRALLSTGAVSFGANAMEKADASTIAYASQLVSEGSWLDAVFVLLHLSDPKRRVKAIRNHLGRHAGFIGGEESESFAALTGTFKIPQPWIWEAKALFMRSVRKDAAAEVHCLLRAGAFTAAHRTFVEQFAPTAVVERNYQGLSDLLTLFHGHEGDIPGWRQGGEVYRAFLQLVGYKRSGQPVPTAILELLLAGLPAMHQARQHPDVLEAAALADMSAEIADVTAAKAKAGNRDALDMLPKVLKLPLTSDTFIRYSDQLAREVFWDVVAHG